MAIKSILVHVDGGPSGRRRAELAFQLADMFGAAVNGLGAETLGPMFGSGFAGVDNAMVAASQRRVDEALRQAESQFRAIAEGRAPSEWSARESYPEKALALHARGADLIVAGRPQRGQGASVAATPAELIMEAGAPILIAPESDTGFSGARVLIGWKDTREARRALSDALPFLERADAVRLATVESHPGPGEGQALADVIARLGRHGVRAEAFAVKKGRASVAEALESEAERMGADLIVTGAYGHSRLREWILGGVTEDFLAASTKYVLLSH